MQLISLGDRRYHAKDEKAMKVKVAPTQSVLRSPVRVVQPLRRRTAGWKEKRGTKHSMVGKSAAEAKAKARLGA